MRAVGARAGGDSRVVDIDRLMQLMLSEAQSRVLESVASACEHVTWTITARACCARNSTIKGNAEYIFFLM